MRNEKTYWRNILYYLGPIVACYFIFFSSIAPDNPMISKTLGVGVWMAFWWVSEFVPLAITSLLPIVLFPLLGIMDGKEVSSTYFNHVIFLFIGGFLMALAIQRWDLHKRIALYLLKFTGTSPGRILFGFMFATAFLSMWISNTATTMMMIPILLSITTKLVELNGEKSQTITVGLLLATAYSASVGGIATLIGTPPNLSFSRIYSIYFPQSKEIAFSDWFVYALPITVLMFVAIYILIYLLYIHNKNWVALSKNEINEELKKLGKVKVEEKVIGLLFLLLVFLWFFRTDFEVGAISIKGWGSYFGYPKYINDGTVAIAIAILLFMIPSNTKGRSLMTWKDAEDLPWEIILLFGGGFALATGFKESGLSSWIGEQLIVLKGVHPLILIIGISFIVTFLTELTSNTATVETFLPLLAGLAISIEINPLLLMVPATISGSMAFMLPVATPPNAIIFGTKKVRIVEMMKAGLLLNIVAAILISFYSYFFLGILL